MALAVLNRAQGGAAASASTIVSPAQAHSAGNLLVALITFDRSGGNITSVTNTAGDTWLQAGTQFDAVASNNKLNIYYVENSIGNASDVVTVALGAGTVYRSIVGYEVSGQATSSTLNTTASDTQISTALSSGTLTIAAASEIIFAIAIQTPTITPGTGYTGTNFAITGDANAYFLDEYHVITASEAATATGPNNRWAMLAASFKAAGGATPFIPLIGRGPGMALAGHSGLVG